MRIGRFVALCLTLLSFGCARESRAPERPESGSPAQVHAAAAAAATESGQASYYGKSLAGHRTANGERYDPRAFTAAHRRLPFGTKVRVTRADDGRSVIVRVNDRGPFGGNRIIDVSRAAAEELGMIRAGVVSVRIEVVEPAPGR